MPAIGQNCKARRDADSSGLLVQNTCDAEDPTTCIQTQHTVSNVACKSRESTLQNEKVASHVLEGEAKLTHLQSEIASLQSLQKDKMKEIAEKDLSITKLQASILLLQQEGVNTRAQLELSRKQAVQQSLALSVCRQKEEILLCKVLSNNTRDGTKKSQCSGMKIHHPASSCITRTHFPIGLKRSDANVKQLDETTVSLQATQDSLRRILALREKHTQQLLEDNAHLKDSLAALQSQLQTRECTLSDVRATLDRARVSLDARRQTRLQIQEQSERASKAVECLQQELTSVHCTTEKKEKSLVTLCEERVDLRAKMMDVNTQHVHLSHAKDTLEVDFALCREELHACHLEVQSRDQLILQLRSEMKSAEETHQTTQQRFAASEEELQKQQVDLELLHRQLKVARGEFKGACLQAEEQKEMAVIFKHKYTAAMEKVHRVQEQVKHLAEELRYSQQQIRESQQATHLLYKELSELKRRHQDKVGQWESSQVALDQLTDELSVSQNLLTESQQKVAHLDSLVCGLQGQVETLKQQSHSHTDEDYLSLHSHNQKLQKRCSEQVERLVECEKVILQMKSELERQNQEQACRAHLNRRGQLEQEVAQLKEEVARLELELANSQTSEEALQEARKEPVRCSGEVDVQRKEVQRLEDVIHKEEEKLKSAYREKHSLSTHVRQLSQELEELHCKHHTTVQVLAARSKEAKHMVVCLNEAKQAQDKTSFMARRLESEVAELKRNLQQADMEKRDAEAQVDTLQYKLAASCTDNDNLRHESQLIVTNLKQWVTEQKNLQEANDTLVAEVKRLKEVATGQKKEMGHVKAHMKNLCAIQDEKILDKETCMVLNLARLADMQTKLQRNMDAISLLNQQLKAVSKENKHLRRQLEEERCMYTQVECHRPLPPTCVHLPASARPPLLSITRPSSPPPRPSSSSSSQPERSDKGH
ncbi:paramyosin-like isoform X3 [Phyllopteryx taeniolatus]|uniref:paramyosin-like isoform X3 n=1 Tax=Phyllopteryx taeniolatus TaxID=161469 RepID=UPI002AD1E221|nr:paramyosin-like isoform X3 [Phyllopteryx taeniolatus]